MVRYEGRDDLDAKGENTALDAVLTCLDEDESMYSDMALLRSHPAAYIRERIANSKTNILMVIFGSLALVPRDTHEQCLSLYPPVRRKI